MQTKTRASITEPIGLVIRKFNPEVDSISELTKLINRSFSALTKMGLNNPSATQNEAQTLQRIRHAKCLVAFLDEQLVGTITYFPAYIIRDPRWFLSPGMASFEQFAIAPEYQSAGIGRILLQRVEELAQHEQVTELALSTPEPAKNLVQYYRSKGYDVAEITRWANVNYASCIMRKKIFSDHISTNENVDILHLKAS